MTIIEALPEHLDIAASAALAGCSTKTIRRAVADEHLPRRYVMGPRGPQLVFLREELEAWAARPARRHRSTRPANGHARWVDDGPLSADSATLTEQIAHLQGVVDLTYEMIRRLSDHIEEQDSTLAASRAAIERMANAFARLERRLHNPRTSSRGLAPPLTGVGAAALGSAGAGPSAVVTSVRSTS